MAIDQGIQQGRFELLAHQRLVQWMLGLGKGIHQHFQEAEEVLATGAEQVQLGVELDRPVQSAGEMLGEVLLQFTLLDADGQLG
ncbi:hypothetical protein D3C81_2143110 [compost metagenome]